MNAGSVKTNVYIRKLSTLPPFKQTGVKELLFCANAPVSLYNQSMCVLVKKVFFTTNPDTGGQQSAKKGFV